MRSLLFIQNVAAGLTEESERIEKGIAALEAHGWQVYRLELLKWKKVERQIREKLSNKPRIDTVVVAGGDGTVNAAVQVLQGTELRLAIIPTGTFNHFARHMGVPLDLAEAFALVNTATATLVDVASVNGRYFVNMSIVGMYTKVILLREKLRRQGYKKFTAFALALFSELYHYRSLRLSLESGDAHAVRSTPLLFIGNSTFTFGGTDLLKERKSLEEGKLQIGIAKDTGLFGMFVLWLRAWRGTATTSKHFETIGLSKLTVSTRRARLWVGIDGEIVPLTSPLHYTLHPRSLWVMLPQRQHGEE